MTEQLIYHRQKDIFERNGYKFEVACGKCRDCAFFRPPFRDLCEEMACKAFEREDKQDIIFKLKD